MWIELDADNSEAEKNSKYPEITGLNDITNIDILKSSEIYRNSINREILNSAGLLINKNKMNKVNEGSLRSEEVDVPVYNSSVDSVENYSSDRENQEHEDDDQNDNK